MAEPSRQSRAAASGPGEPSTVVYPSVVPAPTPASDSLAPALAASDQCAHCGSTLAPDQYYCLVCGERRGPARFSALPAGGATATLITEERGLPRPPRFSSAATLIAGVATLLIAMGIGVYIGGLGKSANNASNQPVRVVYPNGAAGAAASTAPTPTTAVATGGHGGAKKGKSGGSHKKASSAASVVTTVKNLPPPTVTIGASGSGKGYQNGKFTGKFFGP